MATRVPNRARVSFIVSFLKACGGRATASAVTRAFELRHNYALRCISTFVSDCRKLGADIRYDNNDDSLTLVQEPQLTRPQQRDINSLTAAVHHAEQWLSRKRRGQIETAAVRRLVAAVRQHEAIEPYREVPTESSQAKLDSYELF